MKEAAESSKQELSCCVAHRRWGGHNIARGPRQQCLATLPTEPSDSDNNGRRSKQNSERKRTNLYDLVWLYFSEGKLTLIGILCIYLLIWQLGRIG